MPNNITDVITFTSPIQTVADGDAANAANFALAPQQLANRTAFLKNILGVTGVNFLMSGNAAAMQAVTNASHPLGVATGAIFRVLGQGLYAYDAASSATIDNFFVYAATGLGGVGRWVHESFSALNTATQGFPALGPVSGSSTPNGKLPLAVVQNALIGISKVEVASGFSTSSATYVDITSFTTSITCNTGDILVCHLDALIATAATPGATFLALLAGGTVIAEALSANIASANIMLNCRSFFTVPSGGSIVVKAQLRNANTFLSSLAANVNSRILVEQYRP